MLSSFAGRWTMSELQAQILYDMKTIRELEQMIERLNKELRLERCRTQSLRDQLAQSRNTREAMRSNV